MLADLQGQEPVVVESAAGETVTTPSPLSRAYAGAQLRHRAARPVRLAADLDPRRVRPGRAGPAGPVTALAAHAVEVAQVETLRDELLGSGDGSPQQGLIARRFPVDR